MNKLFIAFAALLFVAACTGAPGNPNRSGNGIDPSRSDFPTRDAAGSWQVVSQTCKDVTFFDSIFTVLEAGPETKENEQKWVSDDAFDSLPGGVVGTLNMQSGDMLFCYNGKLEIKVTTEKCPGICAGIMDDTGKVEMTCNDFAVPPPTCELTLQKISSSVE